MSVIIIILLCIFIPLLLAIIYRLINPMPIYPITNKLKRCIIGHRAAPIISQNLTPITGTTPHITTDHTKGVFDSNGFIIPENTLPSFELAQKSGVITVELDVQYTKDSQCVVFHDQIIGHTLQCKQEEQNLPIRSFTYEELKQMPFLTTLNSIEIDGKLTPSPYHNARIVLLSDVLQFCKVNNMNIMIEVKPQPNLYHCCKSIVQLVEQYDMQDNIYVASFSPLAGLYIQSLTKKICFGLLFTPIATDSIKAELQRQSLPIPTLLHSTLLCWLLDNFVLLFGHPFLLWLFGSKIAIPHFSYISPFTRQLYQNWGITLLCFTVNDVDAQNYLFKTVGVTIITDHPPKELVAMGSDINYQIQSTTVGVKSE